MKKVIVGMTIIVLIVMSCSSESSPIMELKDTNETFSIYDSSDIKLISVPDTMDITPDTMPVVISKNRKPQPFVNEEFPKSYMERTFAKGLAASTYDLFLIPGNIVRYDSVKKEYQRKTLVAFIKNNKQPINETIADGIIYSNKINKEASFNGSFIIGGLSVSNKQILELVVQDVTKSHVPDSLIDQKAIEKAIKTIPEKDRANYYYVKNATLTLINYKKFRETKIDTKINTTYVTAEGGVYNSDDKFSKERIVSLELVSLSGLITH